MNQKDYALRDEAMNKARESWMEGWGFENMNLQRERDFEAGFEAAWRPNTVVPDEWKGIWQHSNGNKYRVLMLVNTDATDYRYPLTVVYQGEDGKVWSRRADDWHRSMMLVGDSFSIYAGVGVRHG